MTQGTHENQGITHINTGTACIDFNRSFTWIDGIFTEKLAKATHDFFGINIKFYLWAITSNPFNIWSNCSYFVNQLKMTENCSLFLRLSNNAVGIILDNTLGYRENMKGELQLKNITELEAKILTAYSDFLFKSTQDNFINEKKLARMDQSVFNDDTLIHLVFFIFSDTSEELGKIILSFPEHLIKKPDLIPLPEKPIDVMQFETSSTKVDVLVGKTYVMLEDLKKLEVEDILILDESTIHTMTLKHDEYIPFKVDINPRLVVNINDMEQDTVSETNSSKKNIWDSLQVEVNAEFRQIKMTLGELRQITEGLVLDVAPIVQNEITMHVEGKKIASGELVIIGDRYGIKLTKVYQEPIKETPPPVHHAPAPPTNHNEEVHQAAPNNQNEDIDFDESDFEIEDDV